MRSSKTASEVTEAVAADLRKIAAWPDRFTDGQAGVQVAWAL